MKKMLSIAVAAAFAVSSFGVLAQDKKKDEVKSAQGTGVTSANKAAVTTTTGKPERDKKGAPLPGPDGKRKNEAERTDKKK
ncbi:MAG: hypothetical protein H7Y16_07470 [Candidatus Parcubacteria bacterium]|nr:hypothetical protein [Burkholderiales bacterium]